MDITQDLLIHTIGPKGYDFGQTGYQGVSGMIATPFAQALARPTGPAIDFRKSIIMYFSFLRLKNGVMGGNSDKATSANKARSLINQVKTSIADANRQNWGANADEADTIGTKVKSALQSAKTGAPAVVAGAIDSAIIQINNHLPDILKAMLAELSKIGLPIVSNIKNVATNMKTCIEKAIILYKSSDIDNVLRVDAKQIIGKFREKLKTEALLALGEAAFEFAKGLSNALTGCAAEAVNQVVTTIKKFLQFIWLKFNEYKEYHLLQRFFASCVTQRTTGYPVVDDQQRFTAWFTPYINALPIVAAHCICGKGTGNYVGFITAIKEDGTEQSTQALARGLKQFEDIKKPATAFAKSYAHEFTSDELIIQQFLRIMSKGGVDLSGGEAAKNISWFRKGLMKLGLQKKHQLRLMAMMPDNHSQWQCKHCQAPMTFIDYQRSHFCMRPDCQRALAQESYKTITAKRQQAAKELADTVSVAAEKHLPDALSEKLRHSEVLIALVPTNNRDLVPLQEERKAAFLELVGALFDDIENHNPDAHKQYTDTLQPPATKHVDKLKKACATCRGKCCEQGGDHAFQDVHSLSHIIESLDHPATKEALQRMFSEHFPSMIYERACVFQGSHGCALPNELRSFTCHNYMCKDLGEFTYLINEDPDRACALAAYRDGTVSRISVFDDNHFVLLDQGSDQAS